MRKPSVEELRELGAAYRIDINDGNADHIESLVAEMFDGFKQIETIPIKEGPPNGERSWREPTVNPYNEIVHHCDVPSIPDADRPVAGMEIGLKTTLL